MYCDATNTFSYLAEHHQTIFLSNKIFSTIKTIAPKGEKKEKKLGSQAKWTEQSFRVFHLEVSLFLGDVELVYWCYPHWVAGTHRTSCLLQFQTNENRMKINITKAWWVNGNEKFIPCRSHSEMMRFLLLLLLARAVWRMLLYFSRSSSVLMSVVYFPFSSDSHNLFSTLCLYGINTVSLLFEIGEK